MSDLNTWREGEIKKIGLSEQLKAEAVLDKHNAQPFIETVNQTTGERVAYKKDVAEIYMARKTHKPASKTFTVPAIPGFNC